VQKNFDNGLFAAYIIDLISKDVNSLKLKLLAMLLLLILL
jgi:hypothetical protein